MALVEVRGVVEVVVPDESSVVVEQAVEHTAKTATTGTVSRLTIGP